MFCPFSPVYSRDFSPLAGPISLVAARDRGRGSDRSKAMSLSVQKAISPGEQPTSAQCFCVSDCQTTLIRPHRAMTTAQ